MNKMLPNVGRQETAIDANLGLKLALRGGTMLIGNLSDTLKNKAVFHNTSSHDDVAFDDVLILLRALEEKEKLAIAPEDTTIHHTRRAIAMALCKQVIDRSRIPVTQEIIDSLPSNSEKDNGTDAMLLVRAQSQEIISDSAFQLYLQTNHIISALLPSLELMRKESGRPSHTVAKTGLDEVVRGVIVEKAKDLSEKTIKRSKKIEPTILPLESAGNHRKSKSEKRATADTTA